MLLSETAQMGKGVEVGMRILSYLLLQSTQSQEENSSFAGDLKKPDLKVYKAAGQNIYSFLLQRLETFRVGKRPSTLTASFHR